MSGKPVAIATMIKSVRACFQDLKALGDKLHEDFGVTDAMRAVMEFLDERGAHTVPEIARVKNVSRQHIQVLVGTLTEKGFVAHAPNPAHKRSSLVGLTVNGRKTFLELKKRESIIAQTVGRKVTVQDITSATETLEKFRRALDRRPS